jgi:hypothetical protein
MQHAHPVGLALSRPLLERLDTIARSEGVSRSSLARTLLLKAVAAYERNAGATHSTAYTGPEALRLWRPRNVGRRQGTLASSEQKGQP